MSPEVIFNLHLVLGYVAWLLCFFAYIWPALREMESVRAQRAIATLHSFRFLGLVFLVPGVVGSNLPANFAGFAENRERIGLKPAQDMQIPGRQSRISS